MFSKDFVHEGAEAAATKTLALLATSSSYTEDFNAADTGIKVLEKLNKDTFIMVKNRLSAAEKCWTCLIFVTIRIKTADGFVAGSRTITPLPWFASRFRQALGAERSYVVLFFAFEFTPLQSNQVEEEENQHVLSRGFRVRLGGRTGDGTDLMARNYSTTILFKILLWENVCVKPRCYLTPE